MKKVFSLLLALSMLITGSFGVMAQAQTIEPTNFDEINFQITSKENPDAYIESRFVPGNSAYARSSEEDGKTLVGYVDATVYVFLLQADHRSHESPLPKDFARTSGGRRPAAYELHRLPRLDNH